MSWLSDLLMTIPRGMKKVGAAVADPFYTSEEERRNDPSAFNPLSPEGFQDDDGGKLSSLLKLLGGAGKTAGRVGNTLARSLPIVGPYYQGAEYGVLKGLGKEDSDWAGGNIFAEGEKRREARQEEREQKSWSNLNERTKAGRETEEFGWKREAQPLKQRALESGQELTGLNIENAQTSRSAGLIELEKIQAEKQAILTKHGSLDNYEGQLLQDREDKIKAELERTQSMTTANLALSGTRTSPQPRPVNYAQIAKMVADNTKAAITRAKADMPEEARFNPQGQLDFQELVEIYEADGLKKIERLTGLNLSGQESSVGGAGVAGGAEFSKFQGMVDKLVGEGFTEEQAASSVLNSMDKTQILDPDFFTKVESTYKIPMGAK